MEIAKAVFRSKPAALSHELTLAYVKNFIEQKAKFAGTRIVPLKPHDYDIGLSIALPKKATGWRTHTIMQEVQPDLMELLEWADTKYTMFVIPRGKACDNDGE